MVSLFSVQYDDLINEKAIFVLWSLSYLNFNSLLLLYFIKYSDILFTVLFIYCSVFFFFIFNIQFQNTISYMDIAHLFHDPPHT